MSGGISNGGGAMTLQDFMRLYAPTALPQAAPVQPAMLSPLGEAQQPGQRQLGFSQGQGQQGGSLPFLGQMAQLGGAGGAAPAAPAGGRGQMPAGQGGLQQVLINAMSSNGANGNSNAFANAVGYVPFGTGSFG